VFDNQKVNFAIPMNSRLVQRLVTDGHFCWNDCALDGAEMQLQIETMAQLIVGPGGDPTNPGGQPINTGGAGQILADGTISSAAQQLAAAAQADSGRYNGNLIAYWDFKSEQGPTAYDKSPIGPSMDLTLEGATWLSGGGLDFAGGARAIATAADSRKLWERIGSGSGSGQYSVEAWITPANVTQEGPARIVTYSNGTGNRNFMLGQVLYTYRFRNRSLALGINPNGSPELATADGDEDLQATLQHAVITYDQVDGRRIYVNGMFTDDVDEQGPGSLATWSQDYRFVLANETSNNRPWAGQIRLVAIYERALNPTQIMQNYRAGAFDRFLLRFGLDTLLVNGSYIQFEVSEFDSYSYLFCFPTIVTSDASGFLVKGLKVAVNGVAAVQSQAFRKASAVVDTAPALISNQCSTIPKDLGANLDTFQIFFEVLSGNQNVVVEPVPVIPPDNSVAAPMPDIGIRNFEQVNDTMAELTGVDPLTQSVNDAFNDLREQLPTTNDVRTFVSAHQVAVAKLSLEYCDTLVDSTSLRTAFWGGGFDFTAPVATAFAGQAERDLITVPLVDKMIGVNLVNQPTLAEVQPELDALITTLTAGCTPATCDAVRTRTVVKAVCSAVLSSAPVTLE
jgi:hypothetical protein